MANYYDPRSGTYYGEKAEETQPNFDPNANINTMESPLQAIEKPKPWYMVRSNQILIVAGLFVFYWIFIKKTQSPPIIGNIVEG